MDTDKAQGPPGRKLTVMKHETPARQGISRVGYCLVLSIYAGVSLYCALSILIGPAGLSAYSSLREKKSAMEANIGKLGLIRENLNSELSSLKSDPDRAAREARALGYLRLGEKALVLGDSTARVKPMEIGKIVHYTEPAALGDLVLKEISLGAGIALLALLLAPRGSAVHRSRSAWRS